MTNLAQGSNGVGSCSSAQINGSTSLPNVFAAIFILLMV